MLVSCEPLTCRGMMNVQYDFPALSSHSFSDIGIGQGIQVIDDLIYPYGDHDQGKIQELDMELQPTGWLGKFVFQGRNLIAHPTGLAYRSGYPTFVGALGAIYLIDWDLFYEDRDLDRALLKEISSNNRATKPEYVFYQGEWYVASSEYNPSGRDNEVMLMDPDSLRSASTIDDPGVIIHRFPVSRYVQDIYWDEESQEMVLVQNIRLWKGWRLTSINLDTAIKENSGMGLAVDQTRCILINSELEGYASLTSDTEIFLTADLSENLFQTH